MGGIPEDYFQKPSGGLTDRANVTMLAWDAKVLPPRGASWVPFLAAKELKQIVM